MPKPRFRLGRVASILIACAGTLWSGSAALAQPLSYQGELKKNGAAFTGTAQFKFVLRLGTTSLWSNDGTSVNLSEPAASVPIAVSNGIFTAQLGGTPMTPIPANLLAGVPAAAGPAVRIWVNTGSGFEQIQDQPVLFTAMAMKSNTTEQISLQTLNRVPFWNGSALISGMITDTGTNVGIGQSSPTSKLHVAGEVRATSGFRFGDGTLQTTAATTGPIGPTGPTGAVGAVGANGATGSQGAPGVAGPTGPQGVTGTAGAVGPTGPQGLTGAAGSVGPTGPQGATGVSPWLLNGTTAYYNAGSVGIGTSSPQATFHVNGGFKANSVAFPGTNVTGVASIDGTSNIATVHLDGPSLGGFKVINNNAFGSPTLFWAGTDGRVGVGTSAPSTTLGVRGGANIDDSDTWNGASTLPTTGNVLRFGGGGSGEAIGSQRSTTGFPQGNNLYGLDFYTNATKRMSIGFNGNIGIGTETPATLLDVAGTCRVDVLVIDGGADLAEGFVVADKPEPGMVVSIDPYHPGELRIADRPYDSRVAGVVSGAGGVNPGMRMGQTGTAACGDQPVALTGRVYCLCDASAARIEPGDLLTTSATPGHAMRVSDSSRASGAIIGKAMTPLKEGKGLVLILVTLQ